MADETSGKVTRGSGPGGLGVDERELGFQSGEDDSVWPLVGSLQGLRWLGPTLLSLAYKA